MTRSIFTVILLLTLLPAAACKRTDRHPDTLVIGTEKGTSTLDPRMATDFYSLRASRLIFDGLFKSDASLEPVPNLLEGYVLAPDQKTYDLTLRDNLRFQDGGALTMRDVAATYRYIIDPTNKSPYRVSFERIASMEVLSDKQLRIVLKEPYVPFLNALVVGIVPERFEKEKFMPIGSGPFTVERDAGAEGLRLKRNDSYFAGAPKVPKVFLKPVLEDSARVLELMHGGIDLIQNGVPPAQLELVEKKPEIVIEKTPSIVYAYVGLNLKDPLLSQLAVRQAMAHAINRDEIIRYKLHNLALVADSILSPVHSMHAKSLPQYEYDPKKAEQLLDNAGLKDPDGPGPQPRLTLTYKTSTNPERIEIAQVIVDQLAKVGIKVELKPLEFGVFFDDIKKGNFQLFSLEWSGVTSAEEQFYYVFHSSSLPPDGANRGYYKNTAIDALVTAGRAETNLDKRRGIYSEVQRILAEELPYISLWYRMNIVAARKRVVGYHVNAVGDYDGLLTTSLQDGAE